jgi:S-formylglutathione hydrolase FrmB
MYQKLKEIKHEGHKGYTKDPKLIMLWPSLCDLCAESLRPLRLKKGLISLTITYFLLVASMINSNVFAQKGKDPVIIDTSHYSTTFGEIRNYRIFLPHGYYDNPDKRYPVIYFFHGWSQRYFGPVGDDYSNYDKGDDNNGDNIANYISEHDVIVVKPDGFNPLSDKAYELTPYNECWVTTSRQFPVYFPEFVSHIDNNFRTISDRGHRAVCGLSMGGYMSYWVAGKYPDMVSAAGNFCGSSEFMAGPLKIPVEYKILDLYRNYNGVNLRFNFGIRDNLRFFHYDMDRVWKEVLDNYTFAAYDAAHSTCGLGDMFDFCLATFKNPSKKPLKWDHTDIYPDFSVWGYQVSTNRFLPGFTILEDVDKRGFRSSVREFMPDGTLMPFVTFIITTPPLYEKNSEYIINDIEAGTSITSRKTILSDNAGRLKIRLNGGLHNIGINKTGDPPELGLASVRVINMNWAVNKKEVKISVDLFNKGMSTADKVTATISSTKSYISITGGTAGFGNIEPLHSSECSKPLSFTCLNDSTEMARFRLIIKDSRNNEWTEFFELPLKMDLPEFRDFVIADGKTFTVAKAGVLTESAFLGSGNGDGIANPGESVVILVKDKDKYWRTSVYSSDKNVNPFGINNRFTDFWDQFGGIGSSPKYSVPVISAACPENHRIEFAAEYWVPENKFHIIKQGKLNIVVSGKDITPPGVKWVNISGGNILEAKIYDGGNLSSVSARLIPVNDVMGLDDVQLTDPGISSKFELNDEGKDGDMTAADRVFSKKISPAATYFYRVEIQAADQYGNRRVEKGSGVFMVHAD